VFKIITLVSDPDEQEVVLAVVLFSHLYGLGMIMLLKLMQGAKLITMPKYEKNLFLNLIVEHEVSAGFPFITTFT
jgi:acyl-CoA synthetase (AMP-forming)/AMP-acid ligase II